MDRDKIDKLLNPDNDTETDFNIDAAIEHIKSKTHREFQDRNNELDLPVDLVQAVKLLVESASSSDNVASESVGGELSVTYFDRKTTDAVIEYWRPYRKVAWNGH